MAGESALGEEFLAELDEKLAATDADLARRYPGDPGGRQPVHTVYVPADAYHADLVAEWGAQALAMLDQYGRDLLVLAEKLGVSVRIAHDVMARMRAKLDREPIEDLRIDVEDGYGHRADSEEDTAVLAAAGALRQSISDGTAPPFYGLRFKSFEAATRRRGVRSLDLFVGALVDERQLPPGLILTLPKVTAVAQVEAMTLVCDRLEAAHDLPAGRLRFEVQIETPQSIVAPDGTIAVARMIDAAAGRCSGLHYGTYDYSAACGIAAAFQSMEHPAADHAKAVMQVAAAGTGVRLSDGSTNRLPVGDRDAIRAGWHEHLRLIRRSLERGFYQGWDLHPAQLPSRYVATYAFYRQALPAAAARLRSYLDRTASAVLDEPATARALASVIHRGLDCGALDPAEVTKLSGLTPEELAALTR